MSLQNMKHRNRYLQNENKELGAENDELNIKKTRYETNSMDKMVEQYGRVSVMTKR